MRILCAKWTRKVSKEEQVLCLASVNTAEHHGDAVCAELALTCLAWQVSEAPCGATNVNISKLGLLWADSKLQKGCSSSRSYCVFG